MEPGGLSREKSNKSILACLLDWLSGDRNTPVYWNTKREAGLAWHAAEAFAPQTYDEYDEKIMSGKIILATEDVSQYL